MTAELADRKIGDLVASVVSECTLRREPAATPILDSKQLPKLFAREIDRDPDRVVAWYENGEQLITPNLRRALRADERATLSQRRDELRGALAAPVTGRHGDRCANAVSGMLSGFPPMARLDMESAVAAVGGYLDVVRTYPPWAVIKACDQVRTGTAGLNASYCPTEPEFCELVRRIVGPYELRLRKTEALLSAKAPTDEPRRPTAAPPHKVQKPDSGYARRAIIDRIQKLWSLGTNNPNEAEATSAKDRALALMAQHNISAAELRPPPTVFELNPETWND